ncbi:hypothetical protein DFH29DRAFT_879168 [Suillus ampliporus]|nr:hypothetical protein DFH29DRAFT_879168 [Suillus ampliporus]
MLAHNRMDLVAVQLISLRKDEEEAAQKEAEAEGRVVLVDAFLRERAGLGKGKRKEDDDAKAPMVVDNSNKGRINLFDDLEQVARNDYCHTSDEEVTVTPLYLLYLEAHWFMNRLAEDGKRIRLHYHPKTAGDLKQRSRCLATWDEHYANFMEFRSWALHAPDLSES